MGTITAHRVPAEAVRRVAMRLHGARLWDIGFTGRDGRRGRAACKPDTQNHPERPESTCAPSGLLPTASSNPPIWRRPRPRPPARCRFRIKAVGLNHIDVWGYRGMAFAKRKLPLIVGAEAAGVVAACGPGVTALVRPATRW